MNLRIVLVFVAAVLFSCADKENSADTSAAVADTVAADSVSLAATIDSLHSAFKAKNISEMNRYFSEDGLFIGTDPAEFWTREGLNSYLQPSFQRDSTPSHYTVTKRAIEMSRDRRSGVVIDQFALPFSPQLPVRSIAFAELIDGKWSIRMFSWSFIANNNDVDKLNKTISDGNQ